MPAYRVVLLAALSVAVGTGAGGCGSGGGPADRLAGVDWAQHVRDCATEHGGSGLGTVIDAVVKGDVTGDGSPETLLVDRCESRTSPWPQQVEVYDGASDPKQPVRLGTLLDAPTDYLRDLAVTVEPGGRVVAQGQGLSERAPLCCPDLALRRVFQYRDGRFTIAESSNEPLPGPS